MESSSTFMVKKLLDSSSLQSYKYATSLSLWQTKTDSEKGFLVSQLALSDCKNETCFIRNLIIGPSQQLRHYHQGHTSTAHCKCLDVSVASYTNPGSFSTRVINSSSAIYFTEKLHFLYRYTTAFHASKSSLSVCLA